MTAALNGQRVTEIHADLTAGAESGTISACCTASKAQRSVIAFLRNVPDLQDFDGLAADPVGQEVIAMEHQFAGAFDLATPPDEGMPGQMFRSLLESRGQRLRRVRAVLFDAFQNPLQISQGTTRPPKPHKA